MSLDAFTKKQMLYREMLQTAQQEQARTNAEITEMARANAAETEKLDQNVVVLNETMLMFLASPKFCQTYRTKARRQRPFRKFLLRQHVRWQDDLDNTPAGIINSFLGQLLKRCKHVDLSSVTKLGEFARNDMDAACKRFQKVLFTLPRHIVVFAIIDGLSYYADDPEREEDTDKLLRLLIKLTKHRKKHSSGYILKLFLTAPRRLQSGAVARLGEDEILDVSERLPKGGGFTDMQWSLGMGQQVDGMS
ncbi:hypothetical protein MMC27_003092 [Xylographa pallens]|nr:hypothetical protein [Xylographa pallens]